MRLFNGLVVSMTRGSLLSLSLIVTLPDHMCEAFFIVFVVALFELLNVQSWDCVARSLRCCTMEKKEWQTVRGFI